ncbi:MAG: WPE palindromic element domain-containing protein [Wolbachia endosymbiont of Tetragnatha montana]|nr:WPE palindromic element domain-containing protein [Wolbachia endosymbiont of Tetragnatha montana]
MSGHWDPENLIMYYTTFSIKSWIPVSSTGMTSQGHWNFYSYQFSLQNKQIDNNGKKAILN